jgi:hypothetical protein
MTSQGTPHDLLATDEERNAMNGLNQASRERNYGTIEVSDEKGISIRASGGAEVCVQMNTWRPPDRLFEHLSKNFKLEVWCATGADGVRRFYPAKCGVAFLNTAIHGGLGVLYGLGTLSVETLGSYCSDYQMFRWARGRSEFFGQRFNCVRDLLIGGGSKVEQQDVLPDDVGLDTNGKGIKWTVDELTRRGRQSARAAGWTRPTQANQIRYGLLEAARERPLSIPEAKAILLLRSALFDEDPTKDEISSEVAEQAADRIMKAIEKHLHDDAEQFRRWFEGPKSNLVHQIAKQKKEPGGPLREDVVRTVFLRMGWDAYVHMGHCVQAQMRTFQNALPRPLDGAEKAIFEHTFLPQKTLGGLPMILIAERFDVYSTILAELLHALPSLEAVPIFHQLLDWYSVMATRRREADRDRKRRRKVEFDDTKYIPPQKSTKIEDFAEYIREKENILCKCRPPICPSWEADLSEETGGSITLKNHCRRCDFVSKVTYPRGQWAELAKPFLEERKPANK